MDLNTISKEISPNVYDFVKFWSSFYKDENEAFYSDNIHKLMFDERDIQHLFEWKNGGKKGKYGTIKIAKLK